MHCVWWLVTQQLTECLPRKTSAAYCYAWEVWHHTKFLLFWTLVFWLSYYSAIFHCTRIQIDFSHPIHCAKHSVYCFKQRKGVGWNPLLSFCCSLPFQIRNTHCLFSFHDASLKNQMIHVHSSLIDLSQILCGMTIVVAK